MKNIPILIVAGLSTVATPALADNSGWRVTEASGQVQILHAGITRIATRGGELQSGDTVVTGKSARAVVVRGEDYLVVAPNSRFRIAPPAASSNFLQIIEDWGNVVFKIKKTGVPHFGVQTPYLAAVVKGTTFSITVTAKGSSVQVIEGAVQVSTLNGGTSELVRPGMIAVVNGASLHRLDIQGGADHGPSTPMAPAKPEAKDVGPSADTASAGSDSIAVAITDDGSNLGEATKGLVTGSAAPVSLLASALSDRDGAKTALATDESPSVGNASAGEGRSPTAVEAGQSGNGLAGSSSVSSGADDKGGNANGSDSAGSESGKSGQGENESAGKSGSSNSSDDSSGSGIASHGNLGNDISGNGNGDGSGSNSRSSNGNSGNSDNSGNGNSSNGNSGNGSSGNGSSGNGDSAAGNSGSGHGNGNGNSGNGNGNGGGDGASNSGNGNSNSNSNSNSISISISNSGVGKGSGKFK